MTGYLYESFRIRIATPITSTRVDTVTFMLDNDLLESMTKVYTRLLYYMCRVGTGISWNVTGLPQLAQEIQHYHSLQLQPGLTLELTHLASSVHHPVPPQATAYIDPWTAATLRQQLTLGQPLPTAAPFLVYILDGLSSQCQLPPQLMSLTPVRDHVLFNCTRFWHNYNT